MVELEALKKEKDETAEARKKAEEQIETMRKEHEEKVISLTLSFLRNHSLSAKGNEHILKSVNRSQYLQFPPREVTEGELVITNVT